MELSPRKTIIHSSGQGKTQLLQNLNFHYCILQNHFTIIIFNMYLALSIGFLTKNVLRIAQSMQ